MGGYIQKFSVAEIPVQQALLPVTLVRLAVHFRIDMPVHHENVFPAVVIEIKKACSPAQRPGIHAETSLKTGIRERPVSVVAIERRGVVGEVCLDKIDEAI